MNKVTLSYLWMALGLVTAVVVAALLFLNNSPPPSGPDKAQIAVSIAPLQMIVQEVAGERFEVSAILAPGDSPHTFAFTPSTRKRLANAKAFIYVDKSLEAWATKVDLKESLALLEKVPHRFQLHAVAHLDADGEEHEEGHEEDHGHEAHDPHFWLSTDAVRAILPDVVALLTRLDPEGKAEFERNAEDFGKRIKKLQKEYFETLKPLRALAFVQFHPSFNYFLHQNQLENGGVVMLDPNVAPSAQHKAALLNRLKSSQVAGIFIEPQFDPSHAKKIAEEAGIALIEVDPLGGVAGRMTYAELLRWNVAQILEALPNPGASKE